MLFGKKRPEKKAIALNNKAFKAIDRKDYEKAKELLEESFKLDNKIPEGHSEYAFVMSILGHINFAINHMIKAALLKPNEAKFWSNLAFQYYKDKQFFKALTSTFVAEIVDPSYPSIAQSKQMIANEFMDYQQNVEICMKRANEIWNVLNNSHNSLPPQSGDINSLMGISYGLKEGSDVDGIIDTTNASDLGSEKGQKLMEERIKKVDFRKEADDLQESALDFRNRADDLQESPDDFGHHVDDLQEGEWRNLENNDQSNLVNNRSSLNDHITCSLFSPSMVSPGEDLLIQVFAHYFDKLVEAQEKAKNTDNETILRQSKALDVEVEKNSILHFELIIKGIEIEDSIQQLRWNGVTDSVQFIIEIPESVQKKNLFGKVLVSMDNVPIGNFSFKISVLNVSNKTSETHEPAVVKMNKYRFAFISYASPDREKVVQSVQMLDRLKIDYFQDIVNLRPGQRWDKELYKHIDKADVFFLFWSSAAKDSYWVKKEVEYALNRKKDNEENPPEICPVIVEGPPVVEPPENLNHLHFNDKLIYFK